MIDKLHIKNFLAFPELEVPELKLINLVAGKNGVGKTALLEALFIYRSHSSISTSQVVKYRNLGDYDDLTTLPKLYNRKSSQEVESPVIKINDLTLRLDGQTTYFTAELENESHERLQNKKVDLIRAASPYEKLDKMWAEVALTPEELEVLEVLNTALEIEAIRISVTGNNTKILLKGESKPVDLETLGDGTKRLLLIALSLIRAKKGLLLIDEIETHLHHSVIRKLWKIIFEYAVKWNIQVVATTHSQDAIREFFYEAAANESYKDQMQVLRLQVGRSGKHEVVEYPYGQLEFMMDTNLEIRGN